MSSTNRSPLRRLGLGVCRRERFSFVAHNEGGFGPWHVCIVCNINESFFEAVGYESDIAFLFSELGDFFPFAFVVREGAIPVCVSRLLDYAFGEFDRDEARVFGSPL